MQKRKKPAEAKGRTAVRGWAHDRASHHGQPVVATVLPGPFVSRTTHFGFLWTLIWAAESSRIGPILQLCLIYMPQLHLAWIQLSHFS